jgi:hypothetical protein
MMFENLTNITPNHLGGICMLASNSLIHTTSKQENNLQLMHDAVAWQHLCFIRSLPEHGMPSTGHIRAIP